MPPETSILNGLYLVLHGYGPIQIEQLSYVSVIKDKSFKLRRKATVYFHSGQDFGLAFTRVSIFGLIYWFTDYLFKAFKPHSSTVPATVSLTTGLPNVQVLAQPNSLMLVWSLLIWRNFFCSSSEQRGLFNGKQTEWQTLSFSCSPTKKQLRKQVWGKFSWGSPISWFALNIHKNDWNSVWRD